MPAPGGTGGEIAIGHIVAITEVAPSDEYSIYAIGECPQDMQQIDPGGAHHPDQADMRRILKPRNSTQVSSAIAAPVAYDAYHFRFKTKVSAHGCSILNNLSILYQLLSFVNGGVYLTEQLFIGVMFEGDGRSGTD